MIYIENAARALSPCELRRALTTQPAQGGGAARRCCRYPARCDGRPPWKARNDEAGGSWCAVGEGGGVMRIHAYMGAGEWYGVVWGEERRTRWADGYRQKAIARVIYSRCLGVLIGKVDQGCALVRAAYSPPCIFLRWLQGDIAALQELCTLASHPGEHRGGRAEANDRRADQVSEAGSSKRSLGRSSIASGHVESP